MCKCLYFALSITKLVLTGRESGNHLPLLRVQFRITSSPGSPCGPTVPCAPGEPCKNAPWDITVSTISLDIFNSYFDVRNVMKDSLSFVFN